MVKEPARGLAYGLRTVLLASGWSASQVWAQVAIPSANAVPFLLARDHGMVFECRESSLTRIGSRLDHFEEMHERLNPKIRHCAPAKVPIRFHSALVGRDEGGATFTVATEYECEGTAVRAHVSRTWALVVDSVTVIRALHPLAVLPACFRDDTSHTAEVKLAAVLAWVASETSVASECPAVAHFLAEPDAARLQNFLMSTLQWLHFADHEEKRLLMCPPAQRGFWTSLMRRPKLASGESIELVSRETESVREAENLTSVVAASERRARKCRLDAVEFHESVVSVVEALDEEAEATRLAAEVLLQCPTLLGVPHNSLPPWEEQADDADELSLSEMQNAVLAAACLFQQVSVVHTAQFQDCDLNSIIDDTARAALSADTTHRHAKSLIALSEAVGEGDKAARPVPHQGQILESEAERWQNARRLLSAKAVRIVSAAELLPSKIADQEHMISSTVADAGERIHDALRARTVLLSQIADNTDAAPPTGSHLTAL